MREITYSQDLIVTDDGLLNGLLICCHKIWLPHRGIVDAMLEAAEHCERNGLPSPVDASKLRDEIESDRRRDKIVEWEKGKSVLFEEGVLERLPPSVDGEEEAFTEDLSFEDMWGDWHPGITTAMSLHAHLAIRNAVPGLAFFESNSPTPPAKDVLAAARVLAVNIPTLGELPIEEVLTRREKAQKKDIKAFWQMIDYYNAQSSEGPSVEKIQTDINAWSRENLELRGSALATAGLATLCFVNPVFVAGAAITGFTFLSRANVRWAQRRSAQNRGFQFVSAISRS